MGGTLFSILSILARSLVDEGDFVEMEKVHRFSGLGAAFSLSGVKETLSAGPLGRRGAGVVAFG